MRGEYAIRREIRRLRQLLFDNPELEYIHRVRIRARVFSLEWTLA